MDVPEAKKALRWTTTWRVRVPGLAEFELLYVEVDDEETHSDLAAPVHNVCCLNQRICS